MRLKRIIAGYLLCAQAIACSDSAGSTASSIGDTAGSGGFASASAGSSNAGAGTSSTGVSGAGDESAGAPTNDAQGGAGDDPSSDYPGATELDVPVPTSGRVFVSLSNAQLVTPSGDSKASSAWDLAFEGYDVFTNSGPSGDGMGAAFGPLDLSSFGSGSPPTVPFLSPDKAGGAFVDWYAYDGTTHVLYSRFHVYGVKRGSSLWKVQLITYYGLSLNAPTSAIYQLRYAELSSSVGATQTITVDGTAGGLSAPASAGSGCLNLTSGALSSLTVADAQASTDWDLCFRRDSISVNGEVGGPGDVSAVDLEAADTANEALAQVELETADSELQRFTQVTAESYAKSTFRGDHVVSAFETGSWLDPSASPPKPASQAWLVADSSGKKQFLVAFSAFEGATNSSPGTIVMHIKPVGQ